MTEPSPPPEFHAPSKRTLVEATAIAAAIAAVVLVLFILPAEYNIDPTRFGEAIGIKGMGAGDGSAEAAASVHSAQDARFVNHTVRLTLLAGESLEYKLAVAEGAGFVYSWKASASLYYDLHGEASDGNGFASYQTGTQRSGNGMLNAPFEGSHGWYWRNDAPVAVTIELSVAGHYEVIGVV